jgi:hypothetical protein
MRSLTIGISSSENAASALSSDVARVVGHLRDEHVLENRRERLSAPYGSGPSRDWIKVKNLG